MIRSTNQCPETFDGVFSRRLQHPEVFAYEVEPNLATSTTSVLAPVDVRRHVAFLSGVHQSTSARLLDLGSGISHYGSFLASRLGTKYTGIDFSRVAIDSMRDTTSESGNGKVFLQGTFENTGLNPGAASCAISFDAIYLAPNAERALAEVRRVLAASGRFVMTTFSAEPGLTSPIAGPQHDWLSAARIVGLSAVDRVNVTETWRYAMALKHNKRIQNKKLLRDLYGDWIEPELQVSRALVGDGHKSGLLLKTRREELYFVA